MDADLSSVGGNANEGYSQPYRQVAQGRLFVALRQFVHIDARDKWSQRASSVR
eukprot:gene9022-12167_t